MAKQTTSARGRPSARDANERTKDRHQRKSKKCVKCGRYFTRTRINNHLNLCEKSNVNVINENVPVGAFSGAHEKDELAGTEETSSMMLTDECDVGDGDGVNEMEDSDNENEFSSSSKSENEDEEDFECAAGEVYDDPVMSETHEPMENDDPDRILDNDECHDVPTYLDAHLLYLLQLQGTHAISNTGLESIWKCFVSLTSKMLDDIQYVEKDSFVKSLPKSMYSIRKRLGMDTDASFTRYIMCPVCHTRYPEKKTSNETGCELCTAVKFADHRMEKQRRPCGAELYRDMVTKTGSILKTPKKVFCYQSIAKVLERLYGNNADLHEKTEHWRSSVDTGARVMCDVYDGAVWRENAGVGGFLNTPDNIAFMINVDWFQPFKHTTYSVGCIYLVLMNLPRKDRFKPENIVLVGVIDGPKEPKIEQINQYLHPLVSEMEDLHEGRWIEDAHTISGRRFIRGAILCLSSDIPATRKIGGFVGHSACKGCSKCDRSFPATEGGTSSKPDFSDFESPMPPRNADAHRRLAESTRCARTATEKKRMESKHGVRWTPLLNLPLYDPVRMHVIDPMHNLSGIASHVVSVWKETGVLNDRNLPDIQSRMDQLRVPADVGRIPYKIESNFSGLTADQLINWTMIYSIYALHSNIGVEHLNIWRIFVAACRICCRPHVTASDAMETTRLLKQFCITFRNVYGSGKITPNMHLCLHLESCILDYGPVFSFWCYSFERYNGLFEHFSTNKRDIPVQLMRRFTQTELAKLKLANVDTASFVDSLVSTETDPKRGRLAEQFYATDYERNRRLVLQTDFPIDLSGTTPLNHVPNEPSKSHMFAPDLSRKVFEMVSYLSPMIVRISHHYFTYDRCYIGGSMVSAQRHRLDRACCVEAQWVSEGDGVGEISLDLDADRRPGIVKRIIKFGVLFEDESWRDFVVAEVDWMVSSPHKHHFGRTANVSYWKNYFLPSSYASFIPINRVVGRCTYVVSDVKVGNRTCAGHIVVTL